jgi:hypothetical protein
MNTQNPPDILDDPRKRQPTKRITENGDTHTNKKAKTSAATKKLLGESTKSNKPHRASIEDVPEPVIPSQPQPHVADRIIEATDGSDNDGDNNGLPGLEAIDGEDNEEIDPGSKDDDAELSNGFFFWLHCQHTEINNRPPLEGVGRAYLCLLQANPVH